MYFVVYFVSGTTVVAVVDVRTPQKIQVGVSWHPTIL